MDQKTKNKKELAKKYGIEFGREVLEALFILVLINIIHILSSPPNGSFRLPWKSIAMWSLMLGAITTVTHILDNDMHGRIKDGMKNSIGGVVISSAIARSS